MAVTGRLDLTQGRHSNSSQEAIAIVWVRAVGEDGKGVQDST